jgi:hypothetical protein
VDVEDIHRLADQAKALKDDPAFQAAILALRQEWFAKLMASQSEYLDREYKNKMQALQEIPERLQVLMNDWLMAKSRMKS